MSSERRVTRIRPEDLELLQKTSEAEGRPMTEVLHRALVGYIIVNAVPGVKVPADDIIPAYPKPSPKRRN